MKPLLVAAILAATVLAQPTAGKAQPRPDLVIGGVFVSSTRLGVGETFDYTVIAKNIGAAPCNLLKIALHAPDAAQMISARADSPLTCDRMFCTGGPLFLLLPGHSVTARYTMRAASPGIVRPATAVVDPDNVCNETSGTNNSASSPEVRIFHRPQLFLSVQRRRPSNIVTSFDFFPVTITNIGNGVATDVTVSFPIGLGELDPRVMQAVLVPAVPRNPSQSLELPVTCPATGNSALGVCIIEARLGPRDSIQATVRGPACYMRSNPSIRATTTDDTSTENHSMPLHRGC
jgi:hypothetical protein